MLVDQDLFEATCVAAAVAWGTLSCAGSNLSLPECDPLVLFQCQGCAYPTTLPQSGLPVYRTFQQKVRVDVSDQNVDSTLALVFMAVVLVLSVLDELYEIRLHEIAIRTGIRRMTMRQGWLQVMLLEYLIFLHRYVLIPLFLSTALLFALVLGADSFSLCLNMLVLLL